MLSAVDRFSSFLRKELGNRGSIYFFHRDVLFKYPLLCLFNVYVLARAKLLGTSTIHVIGDSHARPFVFKSPFIIHHISQATAYNLNKDNSFSQSKEHLNSFLSKIDKRRDILLLVFGEIDARVHIYRHYRKNNGSATIDEVVSATVEKYGETIKRLCDDGFAVCVHCIPPAARKNYTSTLPYTGSAEERSQISSMFNRELKSFCQSSGVTYVDVHSVSADEKGLIKDEYADDDVHLNGRIAPFVRDRIAEALMNRKF